MRASVCRVLAPVGAALLAASLAVAVPAQAAPVVPARLVADPTQYVDPMVGTGNGGESVGDINEFPGVDAPFGMMQLSPDTDNSGLGYNYDRSHIRGFSLDHTSAGCSVFGDVPILPVTGDVPSDPANALATFSHADEKAQVGSYHVHLADSNVDVDLSAGNRAGLLKFAYPQGSTAQVLVKSGASLAGTRDASVAVTGDREVSGSVDANALCGLGAYRLYYDVQFSRPFTAHGTWQDSTVTAGSDAASGSSSGAYLTFDTAHSQGVQAKVSMSYVDVAGAQANMAEVPGWSVSDLAHKTRAAWRDTLRAVRVGGGSTGDLTTFYTALYHSLQFPSTYNDADGRYKGFDNAVHRVPSGQTQYAVFSDWDTYRSVAPLQAMLFPDRAGDMANSLLRDAQEQGGWWPKWPVANVSTTGTMNGDNGVPLFANLVAFGAKNVDIADALPIMERGANHSKILGWGWEERQCVEEYTRLGYAPNDACSQGSHGRQGVSETLEWSIDDFAISRLAAHQGDAATARTYQRRAQNWQNTFNPNTGYFQVRDERGAFPNGPAFVTPPDGAFGQDGYDESNAAGNGWEVPQNMAGLIAAMGGPSVAIPRLDEFFTKINAGPNDPHMWAGNEVDLVVPYAYNYLGQPWKTQAQVREQEQALYGPTPNGMPGNDDLGALSSWYVWSALGLYPVTPGTSDLTVGSPLFQRAQITLGSGRTIDVNAPAAGTDAPYVSSLRLDGQQHDSTALPQSLASDGGTLDFAMSTSPNTAWASGPDDAPPSYRTGEDPAIAFWDPSGSLTLAAGSSSAVRLGVQGTAPAAGTVHWQVHAPAGVTVSPASGTFDVAAGARTDSSVTVSASASATPSFYPVTVDLTSRGHQLGRRVLTVTVPADDGTAVVADDLGDPDSAHGLYAIQHDDGRTVPATAGGRTGRTTHGTRSNYVYIDVDNGVALDGDFDADLAVTYFDHGTTTWSVQYDATNGSYETAGTVTNTGTDTWKTATIHLPHARFNGGENNGTDLRLGIGHDNGIVVDRVAMTVTGDHVVPVHLAAFDG